MYKRKVNNIDEYQETACKTFKDHLPMSCKEAQLLDWSLGLPGETGEVCEIIKHHVFHHEELDKMELAKELGDVMWYVAAIAASTGISLSSIMALNLDKLQHRYDAMTYQDDNSAGRHAREKKFDGLPIYEAIKFDINHPSKLAESNIVFIGPDGSGKTTIAKRLAETIGFKYVKNTWREDHKYCKTLDYINNSNYTIFDRLYYPDDIIYNEVKNTPLSDTSKKCYYDLEPRMIARNYVFIYVDASDATLHDRLGVRGDEYITPDMLGRIRYEYTEFLKRTKIPVLQISTEGEDPDTCVTQIIKWLGGLSNE